MHQVTVIYLKKLLTDAGYDMHEEVDGWIVGTSSYYRHKAAVKIAELPVLALPEKVAMQLNLFEGGHFILLEDAPQGFPFAMALETHELLWWLKKSVKLEPEQPVGVTTTDVETLVKQRRGQEKLRERLFGYWGGRCAVTGVSTPAFLVASHIKPWAECDTAEEKLDLYNALLLNTALDRAFDQGYISFADSGSILLGSKWDKEEAASMGIAPGMRLRHIDDRHKAYLQYHRENIWMA